MKKEITTTIIAAFMACVANATPLTSPDGRLSVTVECGQGMPTYSVAYNGETVIKPSALGLDTNVGDFTKGLTPAGTTAVENCKTSYRLYGSKQSDITCEYNEQAFTFKNKDNEAITVLFRVKNNDVAFRYLLQKQNRKNAPLCCVIDSEATAFTMPQGTTTFLCPQMGEMTGFARTAPSYETHYEADGEMGKNGWGNGYTFPCLFKVRSGDKTIWTLVSETGVDGNYCASHLEGMPDGMYRIAFPSIKENNGYGSNTVQASVPGATPWRTITIGETLKPIVETTIPWDMVESHDNTPENAEAYIEAAKKYGRGSWSWIIANDESCNYDTQKQYIDFSAAMGWESLLIDAQWDMQIGRERIAELARYGREKGVSLYLWYNSNGTWNDAPQTPRDCMDRPYRRKVEMAWMKSIGIRGIKVDFFGGDKQCTMQLYEDILRDAQDYGLLVIFHGCTLPRGWERMYPNYVASEAVRASENLHFGQNDCDREAMDATFLPFIRNTVGSMDFGGSTLNWYYNARNEAGKGGGHRVTSDVFALATAILFQSPVQHFAMAPNNLDDAPTWAVDFMKRVPTTWDEVQYIDGYPGRYVVLARRTGDKWYVTGVNGTGEPLRLSLTLPMLPAGSTVTMYSDNAKAGSGPKKVKLGNKPLGVTIPVNGGIVIEQ